VEAEKVPFPSIRRILVSSLLEVRMRTVSNLFVALLALVSACHSNAVGRLADGGDGDGGSSDGGADGGSDAGCIGGAQLGAVGKHALLVGALMADATATAAAFDVRYQYLAGGLPEGAGPCDSCAMACFSKGRACTNGSQCPWWGCFQSDQERPGAYVRTNVAAAEGRFELPMFTYAEFIDGSGANGAGVITAANDSAFLARYFNDFRFALQQMKDGRPSNFHKVILHLEPSIWSLAQQVNNNPHSLPAAVATANPTDCADQENSIAGFGKCLIAMTRKYAPGVLVGLHGVSFASGTDVLLNTDPSLDVAAEANKVAAFLVACGAADGDFVATETSDRDSGYYATLGKNTAWDATNATLPNFHQAFAWAKALAEGVGKPIVYWQTPIGNAAQTNVPDHWKDNRVDYFFAHTGELVAAHVIGIFFGTGAAPSEHATLPETDGDNLINKVRAYTAAGGQPACP